MPRNAGQDFRLPRGDDTIGSNSAPPLPADPKRMCVRGLLVRFGSFDPAVFRDGPLFVRVDRFALLLRRSDDLPDAMFVPPSR
jgi:hypothetical protein